MMILVGYYMFEGDLCAGLSGANVNTLTTCGQTPVMAFYSIAAQYVMPSSD